MAHHATAVAFYAYFRFTGSKIMAAPYRLRSMQARYYDPVIGRFLSVDPVTFLDTGVTAQFNRYSYTANDPINWTDPNGEFPWCVVLAVIYVADKAYGAYDAAQTAKGIADGSIDTVDAAVEQANNAFYGKTGYGAEIGAGPGFGASQGKVETVNLISIKSKLSNSYDPEEGRLQIEP